MPKRGLELSKTQINAYCKKHNFPNPLDNSGSSGSDTKQGVRHGTLAESEAKEGNPSKCLVSIVSYRVRLADVEGLCGKWHLDALRYAGVIRDDTEEAISYQISQKKVEHRKQEKTLITVTFP